MKQTDVWTEAVKKLSDLTAEMTADGDFSLADHRRFLEMLQDIQGAVEYQIAKIEEALEAARSHAADKNGQVRI